MKLRKLISIFLVAFMILMNIAPGYAVSGRSFLPDKSLLIVTTAFNLEARKLIRF
jgi:hypothetical protein